MSDPDVNTAQLNSWLERMRAGDLTARDELLRACGRRLEHLARKMLRDFPNVKRWEDTNDVLQNALLRLLRSLAEVEPTTTTHFFNLAALQIRRELLELARTWQARSRALGESIRLESSGGSDPVANDDADDLERWCAFHEAVERLPAEEREVVGLIFYHGWDQAQVAEVFGVSDRTVRRRWDSAMVRLHGLLRGLDSDENGPGS